MTVSTYAAAKKICEIGNWGVSNLQLQKILYLSHMMFMGKNAGEPLINDKFQAWDYGPVVPELYHQVKMYGSGPIRTGFYSVPLITSDTKEGSEIEKACSFLLQQTPGRLVEFTHRTGGAWEKNYIPGYKGIVIPNDDILIEYKELFNVS